MDCSQQGSSVHGIFQARILEWVSIFFTRGSFWSRDRTHISCLVGEFFTTELPGKPPKGCVIEWKSLSCVQLFMTSRSIDRWVLLSMEFSTEYFSEMDISSATRKTPLKEWSEQVQGKRKEKKNGAATNGQTLLSVLKISHLIVKITLQLGYEPHYKYEASGTQRG